MLPAQPRLVRHLFLIVTLAVTPALAAKLYAQAAPPPPQETPIPIHEDPNDPLADRKTRIERQEALIRKQLEERRRRLEAIRLQREQAAAQQNGQPDPNNPNAGQPGQPNQPGQMGYPRDGAPPNPNQPQQAQPAIAPPQPGGVPGAPAPPGAAPGGDGTVKVPATNQVTFYVSPATLVLNVGERIVTETGLLNPSGIHYDGIEVALQFPSHALRPIAIHEAHIRPLLKADADTQLDMASGRFIYRGELTSATQARSVPLVTIEWEAIAPIRQGQISTAFGENRSGAYQGVRFVSAGGLGESQLGANLRIGEALGDMPAGLLMANAETMAQAVDLETDPSTAPPRLWIEQPAEGEFQPGQWVVIDLGIDNPGRVPFDEVRLAARFDPDAVELIDSDRDNLIDRGRNVLDGPFRSLWPWEMLYVNRIEQDRGVFYYRMASVDPIEMVDASAPLIRVFARIKAPTKAPLLHWVWNPEATIDWPQTGVYRLNSSLYTRGRDTEGAQPFNGIRRKLPVAGGVVALESYEKADARDYQF